MSIIDDGLKNNKFNFENYIFNSKNKKYTMYSTEFKKINLSRIFNYDQNISFLINPNGDLLHRCFFETEIPIINLTDSIINNDDYKLLKNNKLQNISNEIKYFTEGNNLITSIHSSHGAEFTYLSSADNLTIYKFILLFIFFL